MSGIMNAKSRTSSSWHNWSQQITCFHNVIIQWHQQSFIQLTSNSSENYSKQQHFTLCELSAFNNMLQCIVTHGCVCVLPLTHNTTPHHTHTQTDGPTRHHSLCPADRQLLSIPRMTHTDGPARQHTHKHTHTHSTHTQTDLPNTTHSPTYTQANMHDTRHTHTGGPAQHHTLTLSSRSTATRHSAYHRHT